MDEHAGYETRARVRRRFPSLFRTRKVEPQDRDNKGGERSSERTTRCRENRGLRQCRCPRRETSPPRRRRRSNPVQTRRSQTVVTLLDGNLVGLPPLLVAAAAESRNQSWDRGGRSCSFSYERFDNLTVDSLIRPAANQSFTGNISEAGASVEPPPRVH